MAYKKPSNTSDIDDTITSAVLVVAVIALAVAFVFGGTLQSEAQVQQDNTSINAYRTAKG